MCNNNRQQTPTLAGLIQFFVVGIELYIIYSFFRNAFKGVRYLVGDKSVTRVEGYTGIAFLVIIIGIILGVANHG